jgi:hypothetical protein
MNILLNELFAIQNRIASLIPTEFRRSLVIDWDKRLIALIGARGTGKTTMVLQYYLEHYHSTSECLYFSADNPLVANSGIYEIGKQYFTYYGKTLIVDEVHKQLNWAEQVKALYDAFPDRKIIILGSSKLNIINQKGDLSRRAYIYQLKGLSFREFIELKYGKKLPIYNLENILHNHPKIAAEISRQIPDIKRYFFEYKQYGFYPFFNQYSPAEYQTILLQIIDKIIYEDVPSIKAIKSRSSLVFKKLLAYLAMSKVPTVNVSSMCNELDIPKETLYEYLDIMDRADLIRIARRKKASVRSLKDARLLLLNPNLYYAISKELWMHETEIGNLREAFFLSQLTKNVYSSLKTDYIIELNQHEYEMEIGGRNKSRTQLKDVPESFLLKDDIDIGYENVIPLYLFGFLY